MADAKDCNEWNRFARLLYFTTCGHGLKKRGGGDFTERELHPHAPKSTPMKLSPIEGVMLLASLSGN